MRTIVALAALLAAFALAAQAPADSNRASNERVIRAVFGVYGDQAVWVARCESSLSVWATNGQYVNLFQMGLWERRTYGWHTAGSSALSASRAAYAYFKASGYRWGPWSCKPW